MALVAQALNRKADGATGGPPTFHSIIMTDSIGQNWELTVDTAGTLQIVPVPRS
jgi:hypothetical protein